MEGRRLLPLWATDRNTACVIAAALALLQPGIDPVFLTLLTAATGLAPSDHGWIVGATQGGMAIGAVLVWRAGTRLPQGTPAVAALTALAASLLTPALEELEALVAIRGLFGIGMGIAYTHAMSMAASHRPTGAYGAVFLIQLLLSTLVALALPMIGNATGPAAALRLLALAPVTLLLLAAHTPSDAPIPARTLAPNERITPPPQAWALAAALFCFIAATMMIWSFAGALAMAAGMDDNVVGAAVAIGSLVGALTALAVMREHAVVPLPLTGLLSGLCLLAPLALTRPGEPALFILAIGLLNIGSTATIIRFSGLATSAADGSPLFRRFVACVHSLGMIAGPVAGSMLSDGFGAQGLVDGALAMLACGCVALLVTTVPRGRPLLTLRGVDEIIA
ncbi:MFS transporter [Sphingobium sp. WCS2017Hpa-17]|uniref:MFS transporter n=1 Tax=Sphingobium sp. WCS2017Hpa-17 TaxID=3073638 RepID=UPI00288AE9C1|nr:MFS transporter [Sphingobium sp. WCS2017Hpa-17]